MRLARDQAQVAIELVALLVAILGEKRVPHGVEHHVAAERQLVGGMHRDTAVVRVVDRALRHRSAAVLSHVALDVEMDGVPAQPESLTGLPNLDLLQIDVGFAALGWRSVHENMGAEHVLGARFIPLRRAHKARG